MEQQSLLLNLEPAAREATLKGRKYHVRRAAVGAECVMNGMLNGSPAPGFYPADVWDKSSHGWSNKPILVRHTKTPEMSADPHTLETQQVGFILNMAKENDKYWMECWFDDEWCQTVDNHTYQAVIHNQVMEVSTGMKGRIRKEDGNYNGKAYKFVVEDIVPDHLAILPDAKGAFPVSAGGGLNILNQDGSQIPVPLTNEASNSDVESAIRKLLREANEVPGYEWHGYLCDVYPAYVIYWSADKLWRQDYAVTKQGVVSFEGDPTEVVRVTMYKTIQNESYIGIASEIVLTNQEWEEMTKEQKVAALLGMKNSAWQAGDKDFLMKKADGDLDKLLTNVIQNQAPVVLAPVITPQSTQIPAGTVTLTPEMAEILNQQVQERAVKKTELIAAIMLNADNRFTKEWLESQPLQAVEGIAAFAVPKAPAAPSSNYMLAPGHIPILLNSGAGNQTNGMGIQIPRPLGFGTGKAKEEAAAK